MLGWMRHKLESRLLGEINNLRYADDTTLIAESKEKLKSLLIKVKEESRKSWLKAQHSKNEDHSIQGHHLVANRWGNDGNSERLYFLGSKITAAGDWSHKIKRCLHLGRKAMTNLDSILKSKDITWPTKGCLIKAMVFPVVMHGCELDHKEGWVLKNWCFPTVVLEKTLESPLDSKEIKPVNPKGNQPWIFIGRTDAEADASVLWPPDVKSQLIRKDTDAGKDSRWEEKGTTENNMVGWHHRPNGYEFEQVPGVSGRQGSLVYCSHGVTKSWKWATEQQQKIKRGTTIWPKAHFKYILQRNENMILKKYMYSHFYYSIIHNNQDMKTIQMWMCKKNGLYTYIRILLSHKKERNTTIWDNMGGSHRHYAKRISQREKGKYWEVCLIHGN